MGKKTEFLFMSEPDCIAAGVLDAKKCVDNAEEVFKLLAQGDYLMGGNTRNRSIRVGDSIRSTSAPMSASNKEANGPGSKVEKSNTLRDAKGPDMGTPIGLRILTD